MDVRALLLAEHALIHSTVVAKADNTQMGENVWARLSEPQLREQLPGHNSVAWIFWHVTRWEDAQVNCLIRGRSEVLDLTWLERLGIDTRDAGTGASDEEVSDLSHRIDLTALKAYRDAVGLETRSWLQDGDLNVLDAVIDISANLAAAPPFVDLERAAWTLMPRDGRTGASLFIWPVLGHAFSHLGDASHVIRSLGLPGR
ncbi:MAG TPA: DinB family protein [Dehalococcoidia bacterium]|nr:DinB family protein [Dehalococcoidia bacterium]